MPCAIVPKPRLCSWNKFFACFATITTINIIIITPIVIVIIIPN